MSQSKRTRFSMPTAAMQHGAEVLKSAEARGRKEQIPIRLLELDPENRPLTKLILANPRDIDPNDPYAWLKREFLRKLEELAASIAKMGVLQPINVYKRGAVYRVIFGERRTLASVLAGLDSVPAIVLPEAPEDIIGIQTIENTQREDVAVWERLMAVERAITAARREGKRVESAEEVAQVSMLSKAYAARIQRLLEAPEELKDAMRTGTIVSLRQAYAISRLEPEERKKAIDTAKQEASEGREQQEVRFVEPTSRAKTRVPEPPTKRAGRKRTAINLGKTTDLSFVKRLMTASQGATRGIDWKDYEAVQRAWDAFLKNTKG